MVGGGICEELLTSLHASGGYMGSICGKSSH